MAKHAAPENEKSTSEQMTGSRNVAHEPKHAAKEETGQKTTETK